VVLLSLRMKSCSHRATHTNGAPANLHLDVCVFHVCTRATATAPLRVATSIPKLPSVDNGYVGMTGTIVSPPLTPLTPRAPHPSLSPHHHRRRHLTTTATTHIQRGPITPPRPRTSCHITRKRAFISYKLKPLLPHVPTMLTTGDLYVRADHHVTYYAQTFLNKTAEDVYFGLLPDFQADGV
jgi:hypothetical protein